MCLFYTCIQSDYFCYSRIIFSSSLNVKFYFLFFFFTSLRPPFLRHYFLFFFFFHFDPVPFDYFHFVEQSVKVIVSYLVDNAQAHNQKLRNGFYMCGCVPLLLLLFHHHFFQHTLVSLVHNSIRLIFIFTL